MKVIDLHKVKKPGAEKKDRPNVRGSAGKYAVDILFLLLLSSGLSVLGTFLSAALDMSTVRWYLETPVLFVLNTVPLVLVMLLLYHLSSRLWIAFGLGGGFFLAMQIVNRFKMLLREEPLTPADFMMGMEAAKVVKLSELPVSFLVIFSCLVLLVCTVLLFAFIKPSGLPWPFRAAGVLAAAGLFLILLNTTYKDSKQYNNFKVRGSVYSHVNQVKSKGFTYSFLIQANSFKSVKPEGYSPAEAKQLLDQYKNPPADLTGRKQPHIIAIMGEAFYDIDRIQGVEFNKDYSPLENFNRIKEQAYAGRIVTDVFGGGTANTEFAFLTGHSLSIMSEMGSPYSSYLRKNTFALPRVLEQKGYSTTAFHPGDSWFYNRVNVYEYFGFDHIYFKKDMELDKVKTNYGYISDRDTYAFALEKFKARLSENPDKPVFEFVVTIDNHGPYSKNDLGNPKILKKPAGMEEATYNILNNYVNGVSRCDQALGDFINTIEGLEEPVVVLYFADHLPFLGENNLGYKALNFDIGQTGGLQAYLNQYSTPYFIWSNKAAGKLLTDGGAERQGVEAPLVSSNYIATELLKYIGLDGGAYFNFLSELKETLSVITKRFYKENGEFTEERTQVSGPLLERYRMLQYYMLMEKEAIDMEGS